MGKKNWFFPLLGISYALARLANGSGKENEPWMKNHAASYTQKEKKIFKVTGY